MSALFTVLLLLSLVALPIGLANPEKVLPWSRTKTRRKVAITYGSAAAICLVLAGITAPEAPQEQGVTPSPQPTLDATPSPEPPSPTPTPSPTPIPAATPTPEPPASPTAEPAAEAPPSEPEVAPSAEPAGSCDPAYPDSCIPPPPPDLDCGDIAERGFTVLDPDPHGFDREGDGVGCEG